MLVKDLEGAELDYWVAKAEGMGRPNIINKKICVVADDEKSAAFSLLTQSPFVNCFSPTTRWEHGGPIIDRLGISIITYGEGKDRYSEADVCGEPPSKGPTPLIAAMRAYVASKFGEEVDETL